MLFGGDFSGQVSIGDSSVSTINSALFYGALNFNLSDIREYSGPDYLFSVYPTIASNKLNVEIDKKVDYFKLLNSSGQIIKLLPGDSLEIFINDLKSGTYFLLAEIDGLLAHRKFVKF